MRAQRGIGWWWSITRHSQSAGRKTAAEPLFFVMQKDTGFQKLKSWDAAAGKEAAAPATPAARPGDGDVPILAFLPIS
jgi:hypothetical protein